MLSVEAGLGEGDRMQGLELLDSIQTISTGGLDQEGMSQNGQSGLVMDFKRANQVTALQEIRLYFHKNKKYNH